MDVSRSRETLTSVDYEIDLDAELGAVRVVTRGVPDPAGFRAYTLEAAEIVEREGISRVLVDHRALVPPFDALTRDSASAYLRLIARYRELLERVHIATVVREKVHFGLVRMWQTLAESAQLPLRHRTFYDVEKARAWLREQSAPARD